MINLLRKASLAAVVLATLVLSVAPARASDIEDGQRLASQVMAEALQSFAGQTLTPAERKAKLRGFIARYVDLDRACHTILGHRWWRASPEQRQVFASLAVDYAVESFASQLSDLPPDQHLEFTTSEAPAMGVVVLHSLAMTSDITPVEWTIAREDDGRLVIIDLAVNGVSIIQTMHSDFITIIRANNGALEPLFEAIRKKIASYDGK
jgi:ABC-type transporter MlaC component